MLTSFCLFHSSGIFGTMKGIIHVVCNLFLFLFVFYRVEEDMVSTKAHFLLYVMKVFSRLVTYLTVCRPLNAVMYFVEIC